MYTAQEEAPAVPTESAAQESATRTGTRPGFYARLGLILFACVFAVNALSWVQFFTDPRANGGDTVRLFTQTDFPAYTLAARMVREGRGSELYDLRAQLAEQEKLLSEGYLRLSPAQASVLHYPYPYTPVLAVLWSPLAAVPPLSAMAFWDLLNLAGFAAGLWFLVQALSLRRSEKLALLLAGLTCFPFVNNLEQGQSSGFVMLALGLGTALLKKERDLPAGLAYGLLLVKIQWFPFLLLVLLWKRRWRALLGVGITCVALLGIVFLAAGTGWIPGYVQIFRMAQGFSPDLLLDPSYSHSFTGLLADLLGNANVSLIGLANTGVMVALAALLLYVWRGEWRSATPGWDGTMCLTILSAMFTNPQLNTHDLCLLAVPAALGLAYAGNTPMSSNMRLLLVGTLWALYLAPEAMFLLGLAQPVRPTALVIAGLLGLVIYLLVRPRRASITA